MASTMPATGPASPLQRLEAVRPRMAKVLNAVETPDRAPVGAALRRAIAIVGLSDKEAADLLGLDKSQLSRWLSGGETIQLHRVYATKLHGPLAIELARDAEQCVVETTVTYRAVPR